jgi:outer membrane biosynthesis protein TonB
MKRRLLAAALVIGIFAPCAARQGPAGRDESEVVSVGFDCPSGESNPNRPEAKLSLGDVTKKARVLPKPAYPRQARAAKISGVVRAEVVIDMHSGRVAWARVGGGHPLLREAVKGVVCGAQFYPVITNGPPFSVSGIITYRFGKR